MDHLTTWQWIVIVSIAFIAGAYLGRLKGWKEAIDFIFHDSETKNKNGGSNGNDSIHQN